MGLQKPKFGKQELRKFIPLFAMAILVAFISNVLRASKDALLIPEIGAEIISSLKLWAVLPASIGFILIYSKLTNVFSKEKVFYIIVASFFLFFACFAFLIYPFHNDLHIDLSTLIAEYPSQKWLLLMFSKWSFSLFYVMCEVCGNVSVFILFWQLANDINNINEAKKYYAFFILATAIGQFISGFMVLNVSNHFKGSGIGWENSLKILMSLVCLSLICVTAIYGWIQRNIMSSAKYVSKPKAIEVKRKMTLMKSMKFILSSKYIGYIAAIIICYSISINILEGIWKSQIKQLYPSSDEYNTFLGNYQMIASVCYMFFVLASAYLVRKFSWLFCAMITPIMVIVTGGIFFALTILEDEMSNIAQIFGVSVIFAAVVIGTMQNILSKGMKYSILDVTKEIAYIPLEEELKTKGKAAADLVGHKFGKSGGAFIQWLLLSLFPQSNLLDLAPFLLIICVLSLLLWIHSVRKLNQEFLIKTEQNQQIRPCYKI